MMKLTDEQCRSQADIIVADTTVAITTMSYVYAMFGPGFTILPKSALERPEDFYFDARCGRTRYTRAEIAQAVKVLALAKNIMGPPKWEILVREWERKQPRNLGVG